VFKLIVKNYYFTILTPLGLTFLSGHYSKFMQLVWIAYLNTKADL